jgi:hypothetical protein
MNPVAAAAIFGSLESGVVGATMQTVSTPCRRQADAASLGLLGREVEDQEPVDPRRPGPALT